MEILPNTNQMVNMFKKIWDDYGPVEGTVGISTTQMNGDYKKFLPVAVECCERSIMASFKAGMASTEKPYTIDRSQAEQNLLCFFFFVI